MVYVACGCLLILSALFAVSAVACKIFEDEEKRNLEDVLS